MDNTIYKHIWLIIIIIFSYGDVPGVLVELEGDKSNQQATILPPICEDCYKITEEQETLKKMNYATTKIWIEIPGASHISSVLSLGAKTSSSNYIFNNTIIYILIIYFNSSKISNSCCCR